VTELDAAGGQGCVLGHGAAHFRVWAPDAARIDVVLERPERRVAMSRQADGFHAADIPGIGAGTLYRYTVDGRGPFPDPASRYQPNGPHGASMVVDAAAYAWRDAGWTGPRLEGQVIYELHVGAFTREGTFDAAAEKLGYLRDVGVTLVEVMPIAEFPGRFNWGYDGVAPFAPYHGYGDYEAFKRFVDTAHHRGIAVILDVVYNHVGPDGAFQREFSAHYFTDRYDNEWGDAINFDGPHSAPVRAFFVGNGCYWIREFHLDGLRLDATQSIHDASERHVLAELSERARAAAGERSILLVAENEPQDVRCVADVASGGFGLDAMWDDDYHHAARVALTGSRDGYLHDYEGSPQEFVSSIKRGFLYQGQPYRWQRGRRGTRVCDEPAAAFVHFIQNHDQVANTLRGDRCSTTGSPALLRALTAVTLLGPQTPMLFMGQEIGASESFPFFADHEPALARRVRDGRREFLRQFRAYAGDAAQAAVPDPSDARTFDSAKLDVGDHCADRPMYRLHRDLLRLRRSEPGIAAQSRQSIDGAVLSQRAFALRWTGPGRELLLVVNFGVEHVTIAGSEPLLACARDERWNVLWSSEHPAYGGCGITSPYDESGWSLPATSATLLCAVACTVGGW
jgi:maltooligosyltrehalose trehalohydrolase